VHRKLASWLTLAHALADRLLTCQCRLAFSPVSEADDISLIDALGFVSSIFRCARAWRLVSEPLERRFYLFKFLFSQIVEIKEAVPGVFTDSDQLIEFEVQGRCVAALSVLDEEHHKESDNSGAGVDDQLPGVGKMKCRTGRCPVNDTGAGQDENRSAATLLRGPLSGRVEGFAEREKPGGADRAAYTPWRYPST